MIDYKLGKIYKLTCSQTNAIYIGSTCEALKKRLSHHSTPSNTASSKNLIKPTIQLIENYPCDNKSELLWRERWFVENTECINQVSPIISFEEKIQSVFKYNKFYKKENHVRLNEKNTCECGGKFTTQNRPTHFKTNKHQRYLEKNNASSSNISGNTILTSLSSSEDNSSSNSNFSSSVNSVNS
mgnify:CR=1 FL=1|tara:strand:+ start:30 stop:581 length:552 start_codon:yes stop_codon:yes gene_type:complete